jgi:hypothetical protein
MLAELGDARGREDGFMDRFLVSFPNDVQPGPWTPTGISAKSRKAWRHVLKCLWQLNADAQHSQVLHFSPSAQEAWIAFFNRHHAELRAADFPQGLRGPWAKLLSYCARLALILHLSRVACRIAVLDEVDKKSVNGAVSLIDYFKSHARRIAQHLATSPQRGGDERVMAWIAKQGGTVSARDIQKNHVASVKSAAQAKALLYHLSHCGRGRVHKLNGRVLFTPTP